MWRLLFHAGRSLILEGCLSLPPPFTQGFFMTRDQFTPRTIHHTEGAASPHAAHPPLETVFTSRTTWNEKRPHVLVVACSDGRLQENVDDFLHNRLGIDSYDRLFIPGGPGAFAQSGHEFLRADQLRSECLFLLRAHLIEEVILIFHGAAPDGPRDSICADYSRKLPSHQPHQIRAQQEDDTQYLLERVFSPSQQLRVRVYRAEVQADLSVRFVDLLDTEK